MSGNAAVSPRWKAQQRHRLIWRSWDEGEYVVYHTGSGDTHLLNEVTAEALRQLESSAVDTAELATKVAAELGAEPTAEFESTIERLVTYLYELGMVEPAD